MSGVIVTGPPRSGTSAVTRLLDLCGLHVCAPSDRVGGGPNNPTGHWESKSVLACNNRLLDEWRVRWWCPPAPGELPPAAAALDGAGASFRSAHPQRPWVCKDPRFSSTLPAWREHIDDITMGVLVVRRPDEVVASLRRTWPLTEPHAAALWMRYVTAALVSAADLPVAVVPFPEVLADPAGMLAPVLGALHRLGVDVATPPPADVAHFVIAPRGATPTALPAVTWDLWERLASRPPDPLVGCSLGPEDPFVEAVLAPLRDDLRTGRPIDTRPTFATAGDSIG